jgi:phosphoglycolate phosphatase-like HAD superfamily hydrolase
MVEAGRELFGARFTAEGIHFAGRLDPLILDDMLAASGVEVSRPNADALRRAYPRHLERELAKGSGRALPGVLALLDVLGRESSAALGLLTGNFAETGCMKLRACGIDPDRFAIQVWGDDSPHDPPCRDHLPGVGLSRYEQRFGRATDPRRVTIIGDTPHDVSCARAHGCRALGVATGQFSIEQLLGAGADRVVANLSETGSIADWLLS